MQAYGNKFLFILYIWKTRLPKLSDINEVKALEAALFLHNI
jgi:hypothetical protein